LRVFDSKNSNLGPKQDLNALEMVHRMMYFAHRQCWDFDVALLEALMDHRYTLSVHASDAMDIRQD